MEIAINLGHNLLLIKEEEDKNKLKKYNRTKLPNCPYCILYIINLLNSFPCSHFCIVTMQKMAARETTIYLLSAFLILKP